MSVIAILDNIYINLNKIPLRKLSKKIVRQTNKNEVEKKELADK